jgi:hypothetical protein
MICFCTRKEIDDVKWDAAIATSWHETPYGYCWYLDLLAPDWVALIKDDYEMVMPLFARRKFGINYLYEPVLVQYTTLYGMQPQQSDVQNFLNAIPQKFRLWEFNIFLPFEPVSQCCSFSKAPNYVLKLDTSYSHLSENYNSNTKRNLKKGEKQRIVGNNELPEPLAESLFENERALDEPIGQGCQKSYYTVYSIGSTQKQGRAEVCFKQRRKIVGNAVLVLLANAPFVYLCSIRRRG